MCFTGSFFLLAFSGSINSGPCWEGRRFPLASHPWQCSRLLIHSLRQEDSGNSNSTLQLCHSYIKQILKVVEAQEVIDSFLCMRRLLGPAWKTQGVKSPSALLTWPWVTQEQAQKPRHSELWNKRPTREVYTRPTKSSYTGKPIIP